MVYFPDDNKFISSGIEEKYAFHSYYKATLQGDNKSLLISNCYDYKNEVLTFIVRLILTLGIEIGIALLFGLRKKKIFLTVLFVNIVTQIILNVLLNIINYQQGSLAFIVYYILLELLVTVIEYIVFAISFKALSKEKPIVKWVAPVYSITANSASFICGLVIAILLPGIF